MQRLYYISFLFGMFQRGKSLVRGFALYLPLSNEVAAAFLQTDKVLRYDRPAKNIHL